MDVNDDGTTTKTWTFLILCEIYRTYTKKKSALLQQLRIKNHTSSAPLLSATRRDRHNLFFSITNGLAFALRGPDPVNDDHQVDPAAQSPDATNVTCASIIGNDAGGNGKPNASKHTPKHEYTPRRSGDRDQHRSRERPSQPWTRTPPTPGAPEQSTNQSRTGHGSRPSPYLLNYMFYRKFSHKTSQHLPLRA